MSKLTPTEFFMRAIDRLPYGSKGHASNRHLGIRLAQLTEPFELYYGGSVQLESTLDTLIKENTIVAASVTWTKRDTGFGRPSRKIDTARRLHRFPDPFCNEPNPVLYLPYKIPRVLQKRLSHTSDILKRILE